MSIRGRCICSSSAMCSGTPVRVLYEAGNRRSRAPVAVLRCRRLYDLAVGGAGGPIAWMRYKYIRIMTCILPQCNLMRYAQQCYIEPNQNGQSDRWQGPSGPWPSPPAPIRYCLLTPTNLPNRRYTVVTVKQAQGGPLPNGNPRFDFERASLALFKQLKTASIRPGKIGFTSEWKDPVRVKW